MDENMVDRMTELSTEQGKRSISEKYQLIPDFLIPGGDDYDNGRIRIGSIVATNVQIFVVLRPLSHSLPHFRPGRTSGSEKMVPVSLQYSLANEYIRPTTAFQLYGAIYRA